MSSILNAANTYVSANIGGFHQKRLDSLRSLKLSKILRRKNPYLFRAKHMLVAQNLVKSLLDAHLSSQEETLFGDFLEGLAIFINLQIYGGRKSSTEGIDLEFENNGIRYIVSIKSGPNWGNSSQIKKMKDHFIQARRVLRTSNASIHVEAVNGCCYGRDARPDKGDYQKYCGQQFWEFISGNCEMYREIIEPLGHQAKARNEEFDQAYAKVINEFSSQFITHFCQQGEIDWDQLVAFSSSKEPLPRRLRF